MLFYLGGRLKNAGESFSKLNYTIRTLSGIRKWNDELTQETKHAIESHWSKALQQEHYNPPSTGTNHYYVLSMFPYPSGNLHMGHVRVYTISDTIARYQRMRGKHVIHPIGWDAFGLPAENAAIEHNVPPDDWTRRNIAQMKEQLQRLGCSFQWDRELATCSDDYYRWTQELFLKLHDAGLVYQNESIVNWDPVDQTVLADEQVDENGCSWRSGAQVERKPLKQWFVRTRRFAKDLLAGLDDPILKDWRDIIKLQQHWIGDCNGVSFDFRVDRKDVNQVASFWTDRPEYIEQAKYVIVSSKHILATSPVSDETIRTSTKVINPVNNEELPVFASDNAVEFGHHVDSYIGIPAVKEKDASFADEHGILYEAAPQIVDVEAKRSQICAKACSLQAGGYWTSAKLRDWLVSRQRYWGTPIPIVHCSKCGAQPVPRHELPVKLPPLPAQSISKRGSNFLQDNCSDWLQTNCPKCQGVALRETDTLDTFVDSAWYFLRYFNPKYEKDMFCKEDACKFTPVDLYIGGKEHAVLHLYYARFVNHFLHSIGMLKEKEPFKRLLVQGMVMGRTFRIKGTGKYVKESDVRVLDYKRNKASLIPTNEPVVMLWEKMSKSKQNGVSPVDMFNEYGVDTTRLLILADVAPTSHRNWNTNTFPGILNWQRRLWITVQQFIQHRINLPSLIEDDEFRKVDDYLFDSRNYYIKGVTFNFGSSQQLSVGISKMQGLTNSLRKSSPMLYGHSLQFERALAAQIVMLAPIAPHFASELWAGFTSAPHRKSTSESINWDKSVFEQVWPEVDWSYNLELVCQVNGNENAVLKIPRNELEKLSQSDALNLALQQAAVQSVLENRTVEGSDYSYAGYNSVINVITRIARKV